MANFLSTPPERLRTPPEAPHPVAPIRRPSARRQVVERALRRRNLQRASLLVLLAIGVMGAIAIGRSLGGDESPRPVGLGAARVLGGHLALSGWAGWLDAEPTRSTSALLPDAKAVKPVALDGVTVLVGDLDGRGVSRLLSRLRVGSVPSEELVAGDLRARVVSGTLQGRSDRPAAALLVPSSEGVSAAVCVGNARRNASAAGDCLTVLTTTVALRGAAPAAASPERADVTRMRAVVRTLNLARQRDGATLAAASSSGRQANAALALSRDYGNAANGMRRVGATPLAAGSLTEARAAIGAAAVAFRAMSRAADAGSARRFRATRATALAAEARLRRALGELGALGYVRR